MAGSAVMVKVAGVLNLSNSRSLEVFIEGLRARGHRRIALDLKQAEAFDLSCVRTLLTIYENLRAQRGELRIIALSSQLSQVLWLLGLDFMCAPAPISKLAPTMTRLKCDLSEYEGTCMLR